MKKQRKHYTPEEKVAILRRHLVEGVPISDLCDELGLQPTVFYRWQKEFFENGAAAFQNRVRKNHQPEQERIAYLEPVTTAQVSIATGGSLSFHSTKRTPGGIGGMVPRILRSSATSARWSRTMWICAANSSRHSSLGFVGLVGRLCRGSPVTGTWSGFVGSVASTVRGFSIIRVSWEWIIGFSPEREATKPTEPGVQSSHLLLTAHHLWIDLPGFGRPPSVLRLLGCFPAVADVVFGAQRAAADGRDGLQHFVPLVRGAKYG